MPSPSIAGVILAGGRSRRMKGPAKPFLSLGGQSLLQHVIDRMKPQVRYIELSVEKVSDEFAGFGLVQVPDPAPGHRGPLGGLLAALRRLEGRAEWLLLAPCDAPFLPRDLARRLHNQAEQDSKEGAVVRYLEELQPTFSLWRCSLLPELERAVTVEGMGGFKQFLDVVALAELDWPPSDHSPFFNINDQEGLDEASRLYPSLNGESSACSA